MDAPNDILIRVVRNEDGTYSREIAIAINDESMLPEMERTAKFLEKCMEMFSRSDASIEYSDAVSYADGLARPKGRILLAI